MMLHPREETLMTRAGVQGDDVVLALHANLECDRCHTSPDRVLRFAGKLELCATCVAILARNAREVRA